MILLRHLHVRALKQLRDVHVYFPRRGGILVEGHNEAGKSTLFEAVYFALYGAPLVGEETRPTLDDLIPHDDVAASVTLSLTTGETALEVRRTLQRKPGRRATQEAELRVRMAGGPLEHISGSRAVNDRILRELSGLDGDALRNSCFMEQKALDRIETLKREDREEAVARLLGMERLKLVEKELREALSERSRTLDRQRAALTVAEAHETARLASAREGEMATRLAAAQLRALLDERDRQDGERRGHAQQDTALESLRVELEQRRERIGAVKALLAAVADATEAEETARAAAEALADSRARLAGLAALEQHELTQLRERLAAIRQAEDEREHVAALEVVRARDDERAAAAESLRQAETRLVQAREQLARARDNERRAQRRDLLEQWMRAATVARALTGEGDALQAASAAQRDAAERVRAAGSVASKSYAATIVAAVVAALAAVAGVVWHPLWVVLALAVIMAFVASRPLRHARTARARAQADLQRLTREHATLLAQREAAQRFAGLASELPALQQRLRMAGGGVPSDIEDARAELERLAPSGASMATAAPHDADDADDAEDAEEPVRAATLAVARAEAEEQAARIRFDGLRVDMTDGISPVPAEHDETAQGELERRREALAAHLTALGLPPDASALAAARGAAEAEERRLLDALSERPGLEQRIVAQTEHMSAARDALSHVVAALRARAQPLGCLSADTPVGEATVDQLIAARDGIRSRAESLLAELDETRVLLELNSLDHERRGLSEREQHTGAAHDEVASRIRGALGAQGVSCAGDETRAELEILWPPLAVPEALNVAELEEQHEEAAKDAHHQRTRAAELAIAHQLDEVTLDPAACRAALAEGERDVCRHRVALEMAQAVRARIVRQVLPETAVYMRMLLPELTAGRYRDVHLHAGDDSGADLRISVWDQVAGRYVAKNLFSGGTRDQCSLALRLAFALATLPKELGAMPGFIFLDEPLCSFDAERTRALVDVLTRGVIGRQFAQVVLISHSQSFGREQFRYHLRMAGGHVADTNLPSATDADLLWETEDAIGGEPAVSSSAV